MSDEGLFAFDENGYTGFISQGIQQGMSGNQILSALQESGLGIRRSTFYETLGEVRASIGRAGEIAALPITATPPDELFTTWRQAPEGMNVYQIDIHVVDPAFGAVTMPYSVISGSPLTVEEAVSQALDVYNSNAEKYGQRILGGMLVGLHRSG
jgi:hypothetical protein